MLIATGYTPRRAAPTLGLKADGTLVAWGYNGYGQLGDGATNVHAARANGTDYVAIAAG